MALRRCTWLAVFCLTAATTIAVDTEPTYKGRTLTEWTRDIDPHLGWSTDREPYAAISRMGTNAIPTLLGWLAEEDPPEPKKPNRADCYTLVRSERAVWGFHILGATSQPAIPELTRLARTGQDSERTHTCVRALAAIGSTSLPAFIEILTNGTYLAKFWAAEEIPYLFVDCTPAVPALMECLTGEKEKLATRAARALCLSSIPEDTLVPVLTNALQDASVPGRVRIFQVLGSLEVPARAAIPAIRAGLSDPNGAVRTNAIRAAQRISPELLTNAPPR